MKLTPHEQKILKIINDNPKVVDNPSIRSKIAKKYQLTEKTLRNRIAELRKRGLLEKKSNHTQLDFIELKDKMKVKDLGNGLMKNF